jgi:hypothetical protein
MLKLVASLVAACFAARRPIIPILVLAVGLLCKGATNAQLLAALALVCGDKPDKGTPAREDENSGAVFTNSPHQ